MSIESCGRNLEVTQSGDVVVSFYSSSALPTSNMIRAQEQSLLYEEDCGEVESYLQMTSSEFKKAKKREGINDVIEKCVLQVVAEHLILEGDCSEDVMQLIDYQLKGSIIKDMDIETKDELLEKEKRVIQNQSRQLEYIYGRLCYYCLKEQDTLDIEWTRKPERSSWKNHLRNCCDIYFRNYSSSVSRTIKSKIKGQINKINEQITQQTIRGYIIDTMKKNISDQKEGADEIQAIILHIKCYHVEKYQCIVM